MGLLQFCLGALLFMVGWILSNKLESYLDNKLPKYVSLFIGSSFLAALTFAIWYSLNK